MCTIILRLSKKTGTAQRYQEIKETVKYALEELEKNDILLFVEQGNEMAFKAMEEFKNYIWSFSTIFLTERMKPVEASEGQKLNLALWLRAKVSDSRTRERVKQVVLLGEEDYLTRTVSLLLEEEPVETRYGYRYEENL